MIISQYPYTPLLERTWQYPSITSEMLNFVRKHRFCTVLVRLKFPRIKFSSWFVTYGAIPGLSIYDKVKYHWSLNSFHIQRGGETEICS